jgi:CsoR family transcriptional regulator, copper-sensing transcriptional repressor
MQDEEREQVIRRVKSAAGHLQGVLRMVEADKHCIDVIRQVEAIEQALHGIKRRLLAGHLETCVTRAIRSRKPRERERVVAELLAVYDTERRVR